ncbi:MAG: cytochrome c [Labilithrix sp.]|nr:cytochrome c [Labilithrix sp.]
MRAEVFAAAVLFALAAIGCKKSEPPTAGARELFTNACARCHGADGSGGVPAFEGGPAPRDFRDHDFQRARTDEQLKMTIRNGKGSGMPPFGASFTDAELAALVAQIRSFDSERK